MAKKRTTETRIEVEVFDSDVVRTLGLGRKTPDGRTEEQFTRPAQELYDALHDKGYRGLRVVATYKISYTHKSKQ